MKRILLILVLVIISISCENRKEHGTEFIVYTPRDVVFNRATGGTAVVTADIESFPKYIVPSKIEDPSMEKNVVEFWGKEVPNPEELRNFGVYEAHGCKITLSDDFKQYTIEVEKDCEWDYLKIWTAWMTGYQPCSMFEITLNPRPGYSDK